VVRLGAFAGGWECATWDNRGNRDMRGRKYERGGDEGISVRREGEFWLLRSRIVAQVRGIDRLVHRGPRSLLGTV
jgi:hypothetical protein